VLCETNINVANVKAFRQIFGLSTNFDTPNIILNGEDLGISLAHCVMNYAFLSRHRWEEDIPELR